MPSNNGNGYHPEERSISYNRVRTAARKLESFTPSDLADELETTVERAEEFIAALAWQGLLLPEVDWVEEDGFEPEPIYEMEPIPDTIYKRNRYPDPTVTAVMELYGGFLLYNRRGMPVRIRTERDQRRSLSTPGARQIHRQRELAFQRQQDAIRRRAELDRKRRIAASQGKSLKEFEEKQ